MDENENLNELDPELDPETDPETDPENDPGTDSAVLTAGAVLAMADELRPNQFSAAEKYGWLQQLDMQAYRELWATHRCEDAPDAETLSMSYGEDTELLMPRAYGLPVYLAWLLLHIDLYNGEIARYNQSAALFASAWRSFADEFNRSHRPLGGRAFCF